MKKIALLAFAAMLAFGALPAKPAKAQTCNQSTACTWTLEVRVWLTTTTPSENVAVGSFAYANFDTAAHCNSAATNISQPSALGSVTILTLCVPTASVGNVHP